MIMSCRKALVSICVYVWCKLRKNRPADLAFAAAQHHVQRAPEGTYDFAAALDAVVPQPAVQQAAVEHPPQEDQDSQQVGPQ